MRAVGVFQPERDRRDQPADVRELEHVQVLLGPEQGRIDAGLLEFLEQRLVFLAVAREHRRLVEAVVEILELGEAVDAFGQPRVTFLARGLRQRLPFGLGLGFLDGRVARIELEPADRVDGDVDMVDAVEPAAPEPVEVDAARVLHRAEEVGRGGALEHPAAGVGPEGMVEGFPAEDVLAEDGEGGRGLAVGVGPEIDDGLRVRHRGHAVLAAHVVDQAAAVAPGLPMVLPFGFGERFKEGVEAFVHPGPLTLVAVDDHREVVVADLMDDHADERMLGAFGVGAVLLRPRAVEADHGILHAADGAVDGPGHGVGVVEGEPRVDLDRVGDRVGGVFVPERHAFLRVEGHRHDRLAVHLGACDGHGVPDELAG